MRNGGEHTKEQRGSGSNHELRGGCAANGFGSGNIAGVTRMRKFGPSHAINLRTGAATERAANSMFSAMSPMLRVAPVVSEMRFETYSLLLDPVAEFGRRSGRASDP